MKRKNFWFIFSFFLFVPPPPSRPPLPARARSLFLSLCLSLSTLSILSLHQKLISQTFCSLKAWNKDSILSLTKWKITCSVFFQPEVVEVATVNFTNHPLQTFKNLSKLSVIRFLFYLLFESKFPFFSFSFLCLCFLQGGCSLHEINFLVGESFSSSLLQKSSKH